MTTNNFDDAILEFNSFCNKNEEIKLVSAIEDVDEYDFGIEVETNVVMLIFAEYFPSSDNEIVHINYDAKYWGSKKFNKWLKKYNLHFEWYSECIGHISKIIE